MTVGPTENAVDKIVENLQSLIFLANHTMLGVKEVWQTDKTNIGSVVCKVSDPGSKSV